MRELYFGYGSNLDFEDWSAFCRERGFEPLVMRPVGPAVLEGEALVFDSRIARAAGAAARWISGRSREAPSTATCSRSTTGRRSM